MYLDMYVIVCVTTCLAVTYFKYIQILLLSVLPSYKVSCLVL